MPRQFMKCGHTSQGEYTDKETGERKPVCVSCAGIREGAYEVETEPDLTGRIAECSYYGSRCKSSTESRVQLPFFTHHPQSDTDEYYCGCYGWD